MTVTRTHTFVDGDTLTAAQLNAEFNNLLNAPGIVNADISGGAAIAASKISGTAAVLSGNTFTGTNTFKTTVQTVTTYSPSSGATATVDLSLGNLNFITGPAGNFTVALSNPTTGQCFVIRILNDASVRTVTWFSTIKWVNGSAPTLSGSSKIDTFGFIITGAGAYDGYIIGQALS